jgi:hypothetical protein
MTAKADARWQAAKESAIPPTESMRITTLRAKTANPVRLRRYDLVSRFLLTPRPARV